MASDVKVLIHGITDNGACSLSGKDGVECINVTFDDGTVRESNLSFKAFQSLLRMKLTQKNGTTKPTAAAVSPTIPAVPTAALAAPK